MWGLFQFSSKALAYEENQKTSPYLYSFSEHIHFADNCVLHLTLSTQFIVNLSFCFPYGTATLVLDHGHVRYLGCRAFEHTGSVIETYISVIG